MKKAKETEITSPPKTKLAEGGPRVSLKAGIVLAVVFAVLYSATLTSQFSYDGLCYALDVEFGDWSNAFHPNHLLYSFLSRLCFMVFSFNGQVLRALPLMQGINAVVGGLAVGVFYRLLARDFGWKHAIMGAAALGFSNAFWTETVDPGCYALTTLAACGLLALIVHSEEFRPFWIGVSHGCLMWVHQMLVLAAPAVLLKLWRRKPLAYLAGVMLSAGGGYLLIAAVFHGGTLHEALRWMFGPAGQSDGSGINFFYWWNFDFQNNLIILWQALIHSFLTPAADTPLGISLIIHGIALFIGIYAILSSVRYFRGKRIPGDTLAALWIWVLLMNAFLLFYLPSNLRFRLLFLPALIYVVLYLSRNWPEPWWTTGLGVALTCLALTNYYLTVLPQSRPQNNLNLMRTLWVSHTLQPNDVFLFSGVGPKSIVNVYLPYFAPHVRGRSLSGYFFEHRGGDLADLRQMVKRALQTHQRVYMEADLFNKADQEQWNFLGGVPPGTLQHWLAGYRVKKESTGPGGYKVNEVTQKSGLSTQG